jgi:hypothetical protein
VLVLESENDDVIPHAVIDWYINANPNARHGILRGAAGHAIAGEAQEHAFIEHIVSFFKECGHLHSVWCVSRSLHKCSVDAAEQMQ